MTFDGFESTPCYHDSYDCDDDDDDDGGGDDEGVQQFPRYLVLCLRLETFRGNSELEGAKDEP